MERKHILRDCFALDQVLEESGFSVGSDAGERKAYGESISLNGGMHSRLWSPPRIPAAGLPPNKGVNSLETKLTEPKYWEGDVNPATVTVS
jgi:hypothetical protein